MEIHKRIDWKKGMEITPLTFIEADNFHICTQNLNRLLIASTAYGLVPNSQFSFQYIIRQNQLSIEKIDCTFIDQNGGISQVRKGASIRLNPMTPGTYYLTVLKTEDNHITENEVPYLEGNYEYKITNILDSNKSSSFPILKLQNEHGEWKAIDFIPPCYTLNSHQTLFDMARQCIQIVEKIMTLLEKQKQESAYYQLGLQFIELKDSISISTTAAFYSLLKKTVFLLKTHHLTDETDPNIQNRFKTMVSQVYNSHAIYDIFQEAIYLFRASHNFLESSRPAPIIVTPKPEEEELTYTL